jgi:hypothetical protein
VEQGTEKEFSFKTLQAQSNLESATQHKIYCVLVSLIIEHSWRKC